MHFGLYCQINNPDDDEYITPLLKKNEKISHMMLSPSDYYMHINIKNNSYLNNEQKKDILIKLGLM